MTKERFFLMSGLGDPLYWHAGLPSSLFIKDTMYNYHLGESVPSATPTVKLRGTKRVDFMYSFDSLMFLISDDVVRLFEARSFGGWETFPVNFDGRLPGTRKFHGLLIRGRASGTVLSRMLPPQVEVEAWDGSDIFMLRGARLKLVTARVVDAVVNAKLTGVKFDEIRPEVKKS